MNFAHRVAAALSPVGYLATLGFVAHLWQVAVLRLGLKRLCLLCARQSGKSTIVAALALWKAKFFPNSLIVIVAPTKDQAQETMTKIKELAGMDPELFDRETDSKTELVLQNGSRVVALPGTEKSVRGYSAPDLIIIDEASRVLDATYAATRPMLTNNPRAVMVLLSTPFGKRGFFHEAWNRPEVWTRFQVQPAFELERGVNGVNVVPISETEEAFKARLAKGNIQGFYSPQHTQEWLTEELLELGEMMWKQEYGVEFVDTIDQVFDTDDIQRMWRSNLEPFKRSRHIDGIGQAVGVEPFKRVG